MPRPIIRCCAAAGLAMAMLAAQPVSACSQFLRPAERIAAIHKRSSAGIVVARVASVKAGRDPFPWTAAAKTQTVLRGSARATTYRIGDEGLPTACSMMIDKPRIGDLWVIYLRPDGVVMGAFPIGIAAAADRRVAAFVNRRRGR